MYTCQNKSPIRALNRGNSNPASQVILNEFSNSINYGMCFYTHLYLNTLTSPDIVWIFPSWWVKQGRPLVTWRTSLDMYCISTLDVSQPVRCHIHVSIQLR